MNAFSSSARVTLLASLSFAAAAAPPLRAQGDARILLLGSPAARLVDVPGVTGRLGLAPVFAAPEVLGRTVREQLRSLRETRELAPLGAVHYQVLSGDRGGALRLSDVMRLPLGSREEATVAIQVHQGGGAPATSAILPPTVTSIEMTLLSEPAHTVWTRELSFTHVLGLVKRVSIDFTRQSGLTWSGTIDAAGLATLQSLADTNNRNYWDNMKLENRGGMTELRIARFSVVLHYDISSSYEEDIPIIDSTLNRTLLAGTSSIDLDTYATTSRKAWAGIGSGMHQVVQLAGADLGKSGSDSFGDQYGLNPKYGGANSMLCSEFVSWYFCQAGVQIGSEGFRDITATAQIDAAFSAAGRRYDYNNGYQEWRHSVTGVRYTPQPGDFLARRYGGEYEHSMIVLGWNDATKTMTVINGPWPVTLRYVSIQDLEEDGYDFRVGKIQ